MFDFLNPGGQPAQPGIGSHLNPQADPIAQAFMLSAGLHLLNGGWGSPAQQVAQSLGQGVEAAAGTGAMLEENRRADAREGLAQQELDQRAQLNADDNTSRERVAKMYTDQRLQTAGMGGGAGSATLTRQERQFFDRYWGDEREAIRLGLSPITPEEEAAGYSKADADHLAQQRALRALESRRGVFGGGKTSPNPGSAAPPVGPPGQPNMPGKTSPNSPQGSVDPAVQGIQRVVPFAGAMPTPTMQQQQGGIALSALMNNPNVGAAEKQKISRLSKTAPGKAQLRAKGINPDG